MRHHTETLGALYGLTYLAGSIGIIYALYTYHRRPKLAAAITVAIVVAVLIITARLATLLQGTGSGTP